jgi:putative oxidoreductase
VATLTPLAGSKVIADLFLLIGRFLPLGLTILGGIIVNIWASHLLMLPGTTAAIVVTILELFLVWRYRDAFKGIVQP